MCGIIGYIGKQNAVKVGVECLKQLEYRGYDSAGIAFFDRTEKTVRSSKAMGRIANLEEKIHPDWNAHISILHTRWATHGHVSEKNAHPHSDCTDTIWLAHNGIIENYKGLQNVLRDRGHVFKSETDSEVVAHLIEEIEKEEKVGFKDAVRLALQRIRGTYGIVLFHAHEPDTLFAARNFSPLLLGIGDGEYFVASDASAILKHTRQIIYLDDGEMAALTPKTHTVFDLGKNIREKKLYRIDWSYEQAQKNGYPHFMAKEIYEQPEAIGNSIRGRTVERDGTAKLGGLLRIAPRLKDIRRIIIAACGTAYYAGSVGEYMLEEYAGIPTEVEYASEFRYRKPVFQKGDALLVISQSGETADTLAALREAREKGILSLGVINAVGSTIAREIDAGVYQHVGPEIGVASTKAFSSQIAILALITLFLGRQRDMSLVTGQRIIKELKRIPELMRVILKQDDHIKAVAARYAHFSNFLFLGRKYNFSVALEGALKLKEISYAHAEGCGAGEMKHGPIAMIDENFPSVFVAPQDSVYAKMISNIEEVRARNGPVIAIATEGDMRIKELAQDVIYIPKTLEMLTPLLSVVPLQLFAYHFGVLRGHDVDKPRNLAKSVTVE